MADHRNSELVEQDVSREERSRTLSTLALKPSGRQSLLSILLAQPETGSAVPYCETAQQLIDAILAKEFPKG